MKLGKFQILVNPARFSGAVVEIDGTDFDLRLDPIFAPLMALFPGFETLHCERYGFPGVTEEADAHLPSRRIRRTAKWSQAISRC